MKLYSITHKTLDIKVPTDKYSIDKYYSIHNYIGHIMGQDKSSYVIIDIISNYHLN